MQRSLRHPRHAIGESWLQPGGSYPALLHIDSALKQLSVRPLGSRQEMSGGARHRLVPFVVPIVSRVGVADGFGRLLWTEWGIMRTLYKEHNKVDVRRLAHDEAARRTAIVEPSSN
jgi:hypothetical protein